MLWQRIRSRLTFANVAAALALFVALGTGGAYAASYIVSTNSQIGPNTVAGHSPPSGYHANLVPASINSTDLAAHAVGAAQLAAVEPWHAVSQSSSSTTDPCHAGATGSFCLISGVGEWSNVGSPYTPAGFYRDLQNRIHLRGLVSWVYSQPSQVPPDQSIFILPAGYRPVHELVIATIDNYTSATNLARVDIKPDGTVFAYRSRAIALSLDGISFQAGE